MTGRCTGLARPACGMLLFGTPESGNWLRPPGASGCIVGNAGAGRACAGSGSGVDRRLPLAPARRSHSDLDACVNNKSDGEADRPLAALGRSPVRAGFDERS